MTLPVQARQANRRGLVDDESLDADRAESCRQEFDQLVDAWDALLDPYIRD